jgi:hypothetical protein
MNTWSPLVHVTKIALVVSFAFLIVGAVTAADQPSAGLWSEKHAATAHKTNWWHDFWADVELHRRRVNVWPEPFALQDRELVRDPFRIMADNGWKLQNTFGDHLFEPDENELTYAGQMKLRWILSQLPPHRRSIFVVEGETQPATAGRVASVYKHMAEIAPDAASCPVQTTKIIPPGGDGSYLDSLDQTYRSSMPLPRLPAPQPAVGATSGSGY